MQHKQGEERNQMFMFSLDSAIAPDTFVRVVDVFVDTVNLKSVGIEHVEQNSQTIDNSEYADRLEANTQRVKENTDYYRKRQQIAEHMYGTLKRQRGFTHTNVRGKEKVLGEVGLAFIGYNLTRCISILGVGILINKLRACCLLVLKSKFRLILSVFNEFFYPGKIIVVC